MERGDEVITQLPGHLHNFPTCWEGPAEPAQVWFYHSSIIVASHKVRGAGPVSPRLGSGGLRTALWHPHVLLHNHSADYWGQVWHMTGHLLSSHLDSSPSSPWNPAPNHSCLAWSRAICLLLARILSLSPGAGTCRHTLNLNRFEGPASTLMAQTGPTSL